MITVPEATKRIVERSRYLSEAISKGIINFSALALYIKPELEQMLMKKVSRGSIVMALKRLETHLKPKFIYKNIFKTTPELTVRSNLNLITLEKSQQTQKLCSGLLNNFSTEHKHFLMITQGTSEITIIASKEFLATRSIFPKNAILYTFSNLSSITIQLPKKAVETSGILYFFLKSLAWESINVIEIVSTSYELTFIFEDKHVHRAFAILKSLFIPMV